MTVAVVVASFGIADGAKGTALGIVISSSSDILEVYEHGFKKPQSICVEGICS